MTHSLSWHIRFQRISSEALFPFREVWLWVPRGDVPPTGGLSSLCLGPIVTLHKAFHSSIISHHLGDDSRHYVDLSSCPRIKRHRKPPMGKYRVSQTCVQTEPHKHTRLERYLTRVERDNDCIKWHGYGKCISAGLKRRSVRQSVPQYDTLIQSKTIEKSIFMKFDGLLLNPRDEKSFRH